MPKTHHVVLNYDTAALSNTSADFGPHPRQVAVGPSDTIHFQIAPKVWLARPYWKLRITLDKADHFSEGLLQHGPHQNGSEPLAVTVLPTSATALASAAALTNNVITAYKCELVDEHGVAIPGLVAEGSQGGEIVPDHDSSS